MAEKRDPLLYFRSDTTVRALFTGPWGTIALALALMPGTRMFAHFDPILTGYAMASLFGACAVAFHYGTWLMRSSTLIIGLGRFLNRKWSWMCCH